MVCFLVHSFSYLTRGREWAGAMGSCALAAVLPSLMTFCHGGNWFHEARSVWSSTAYGCLFFLQFTLFSGSQATFPCSPPAQVCYQVSTQSAVLINEKRNCLASNSFPQFCIPVSPCLYLSWWGYLLGSSALFTYWYFPHTTLTLWLRKIPWTCTLNLIEYDRYSPFIQFLVILLSLWWGLWLFLVFFHIFLFMFVHLADLRKAKERTFTVFLQSHTYLF